MKPWLRLFIATSAGTIAYLFVHSPLLVTLESPLMAGAVVGLVAVLAAPSNLAILGAILAVILGEIIDVIPAVEGGWHADHLLFGAAVAGGVAWGALRALRASDYRMRGYLAAAGLALIIVGMVGVVIVNVQRPVWEDVSFMQMLQHEPEAFTYQADESIYMRTYALMHNHGLDYYSAAKKARYESIYRAQNVPGGAISYRLPAGYVAWSMFPGPSGVSIIPLMLLIGTFAVLSAFVIGEHLVGVAPGLVAATAVALFYGEIASNQASLHVEPWSAAMALGSLACVVLWRTSEPEHRRWLWAAAALAFASASIRELGATAIVAGLIASYFADPARRRANAIPWLASLGAFIVVYAGHYIAVGEGFLSNRVPGYWLQINLARIVPVLSHGLSSVAGPPLVPIVLAFFACWASLAQKDAVVRVWLMVGLVIPTVLYSLFGPAGTATFVVPDGVTAPVVNDLPGYWGGLVSPLLLTMAALAGPQVVRLLKWRPSGAPVPQPIVACAEEVELSPES